MIGSIVRLKSFARSQKRYCSQGNEQFSDSFGRIHNYLRISITERCNLRCTYCMPEEGVNLQSNDKLLSTEEIIKLIRLFASRGVNKIRLTGGEPTVRKDILELTQQIGQVDGIKTIAMTSNGLVLAKKLPKLVESGLNMLNISLDTLDPFKFEIITRRLGYDNVINSIHTAIQLGINPVKVNCVVMRGINDNELVNFVEWTKDVPVHVRFIEYMPFDGNTWSDKKFMSYKEMISVIESSGYKLNKLPPEHPNETSKMYSVEGYAGQVGFITSMSDHFCGTCNRLRLTADGSLKVCLFGKTEVSLRDMMRSGASDGELLHVISESIKRKKFSHGGMYEIEKNKKDNRPMILIGG
eukprot:TRINITY_DN7605_c0_g1_i1.p1 TRINITY_DN7605_c0_g1~~TRINITY_DN7605_c0_g1_i1.p1  ORF type:complete len:354 (-),score=64.04 TRINITY_DN7605_c0_g1_i1:199-1260(-)